MGEIWVPWWNGRQIGNVSAAKEGGARLRQNPPEGVTDQGCLGGQHRPRQALCRTPVPGEALPELRLRAAVARLLDVTPLEPLEPLPDRPLTPEQVQQTQPLG